MNAVNLLPTIKPKSDQLNADDLIGGPIVIKVTQVKLCGEPDQPIAVNFEGDQGKPYKPCKSMRRVMVHIWGQDGNAFIGRRMRLYRDDKVQFGGLAVGGIRISHMSDITSDVTMALTATRANRKPYTVKPLPPERADDRPALNTTATTSTKTLAERFQDFKDRASAAPNSTKLKAIGKAAEQLRRDMDAQDPEMLVELEEWFEARVAAVEAAEAEAPL